MPDGEEKIRVVDENGREEKAPSPEDFDFSDIPILGQDKSGKRDAFSFESFDKGSKPKEADPIASFTKMLKSSEGEPQHDATREMTPEFLERQRQKWEKKAKDASSGGIAPWKIIAPALIVLIVAVAAAVPFLLTAKVSKMAAPPPKAQAPQAPPAAVEPAPAKGAAIQPEQPPQKAPEPAPEPAQEAPKPDEAVGVPLPAVEPAPKPAISEEALDALEEFKRLFVPEKGKVADDAKVAAKLAEIQREYPDELLLHQRLVEFLQSKGKEDFAKSSYAKWTAQRADSFVANYIYGMSFVKGSDQIPYLTRACALSPARAEAFLALAAIYEQERDWRKAAETYSSCLLGNPDNGDVREALALARIREGDCDLAIAEQHEYLRSKGLSGSKLALKLVGLAQRLPDPELAQRCLDEMNKDPEMADKYKLCSIRQRMLYGGKIDESEFGGFFSKGLRPYHMLYLVSKGKTSKALLVPTSPDEFPDFWKVFLSWRDDNPVWKDNAQRLIDKHASSSDRTIPIIASVWLDKIKPDDARRMNMEVDPDSEPLFYFLLAEVYRKQGNAVAAKVLYSKALKDNPNLYRGLIEHYMSK